MGDPVSRIHLGSGAGKTGSTNREIRKPSHKSANTSVCDVDLASFGVVCWTHQRLHRQPEHGVGVAFRIWIPRYSVLLWALLASDRRGL